MTKFKVGDRVTLSGVVQKQLIGEAFTIVRFDGSTEANAVSNSALRPEITKDTTFRDQAAIAALQGIIVAGPHDCTIPELAYEAFNYAEALDAERKKRDGGV